MNSKTDIEPLPVPQTNSQRLDRIDHIALSVGDISEAVAWYRERFECAVSYQDDTWAMLQFRNIKVALVLDSQHPAHLGFVTASAAEYGELSEHRDGTRSVYIADPSGNSIELLAEIP